MTSFLVNAPRFLFLGLLIFAPWAYGCVRPWTINVLSGGILFILLLWVASLIKRRTLPRVPLLLWATALFLVLFGWWMNLNAHSTYDRIAMRFDPITPLVSWAPGAVDVYDSMPMTARLTYLLGVMCFACDLAQRREWRRNILVTMAGCGAALILFGIFQRILAAPMIFWGNDRIGTTFFATYFYHGNAGAFINLVLPIIAGMAYLATSRDATTAQRAIWFPALLVAIAGSLVAASKMAVVITGVLLLVLVIWRRATLRQIWNGLDSRWMRALAVTLTIVSVAALGFFGWDRLQHRFTGESWQSNSVESRLLVYAVCWNIIAESGIWGIGPGNFMITFPHYTLDLGDRIEGVWRFAHQDYLQTVIEWGWLGAAGWAVILLGGLFLGSRTLQTHAVDSRFDRMLLFTSLLALVGVFLHSSVDFPLQIASIQLYVATYLGMLWGSRHWYPRLAPAPKTGSTPAE